MNLGSTVLENRFVRLEPFEDHHREPLRLACDADPDLWPTFYYTSLGGDRFDAGWQAMRDQQAVGTRIPFAVIHEGEVVGLSTFIDIQPANRAVEIGTTYYRPSARGGVVNPATKRLLLDHAFGCGAQRVVFQVDQINQRSQAAMAKLGAVREGVMRNDKVTWTGRIRSSVIYSILCEEWPTLRARLDDRLAAFG
ncbi:GNAT family N-acetyltransferase [Brevundimonas sp. AJA228-03]|uniref:GNAT family N-acetyltransferase n=1 Tax=Brevundimonas sp. AJA228-03 TaxID=2752515 RepID=UPI001ADF2650|nr:GNAT family protein [Brevundimonas sp. AJA228-03]QTN19929.1 GNAT family N-acetyltransferase [Brevundimonas sp. AJA228-03]